MNDECKKECSEEKHVAIIDSLEKLEEFISMFENLVLRVKLANSDCAEKKSSRDISLQRFLNETPEDISEMTARIDKALSELTDLLF